jgi:addiction module HigA family antidote
MSARIPSHPGALLREIVIPALDKPITMIAKEIGLSRQMLHRIMREEAPVTPDTAVRFGKYFGNGPNLWLNMQLHHDLAVAQKALAGEIKKIPTVKAP